MTNAHLPGEPESPAARPPLRRSLDDRYAGGVAGGVAEWLGIDPLIVRIAFVLLAISGGIGIPLYLAAWALIPEQGAERSIAERTLNSARAGAESGSAHLGTRAPWRVGPDPKMRVSDAERQEVADMLSKHYGDGRLDPQEFEERMGKAMGAKTRGDLDGLFYDLPPLAPAAATPVRRRPLRPVAVGLALGLGLLWVAGMVVVVPGHHVWWLLLLVVLLVGRSRRRRAWRQRI